jgi:glycosyltransferase involved in cell wall biosynthesis
MDRKAMHPLVSVGIPTYERLDGLRNALQCITGQTYRNLEIIVSDNATTGTDTDEMMAGVVSNDTRVRYHKQRENVGAAANFAFVLAQATGKYFLWAADDDLCEADFIEKIVRTMEAQPDIVLCGCDVKAVDEYDRLLQVHQLETIRPQADWKRARKLFYRYPTSNIFVCIYGIYRTDALRGCGLDIMKGWKSLLTNWEVPFLAKLSGWGRIAAVPEILKTYRVQSRSVYNRERMDISPYDSFMLRVVIRARLCKLALVSAGSLHEKSSLLRAVAASGLGPITVRNTVHRVRRLWRQRHRA